MIRSEVIAHSIHPDGGPDVVSSVLTFHRFVQSQLNTHGHAKNSASNRARPVKGVILDVVKHTALPVQFGTNKPGMQAGPPLLDHKHTLANLVWIRSMLEAVSSTLSLVLSPTIVQKGLSIRRARTLAELGGLGGSLDILNEEQSDVVMRRYDTRGRERVIWFIESLMNEYASHDDSLKVAKEVANRLLEPYMWSTGIHTAALDGPGSTWENLLNQRASRDGVQTLSQPEIAILADSVRDSISRSEGVKVAFDPDTPDGWHKPFTERFCDQSDLCTTLATSVARAARVSYLNHMGESSLEDDLKLFVRLAEADPPHYSPFEHLAIPINKNNHDPSVPTGRISGWTTLRHMPGRMDGIKSGVKTLLDSLNSHSK